MCTHIMHTYTQVHVHIHNTHIHTHAQQSMKGVAPPAREVQVDCSVHTDVKLKNCVDYFFFTVKLTQPRVTGTIIYI